MCGSDAVPAIMHSTRVMNLQLSSADVPAAACAFVSATTLKPSSLIDASASAAGISAPT